MLWNVLLLLFSPWYLLLSRLLRDDRDRQILLLHQQLLIAQRRAGKRFCLSRGEKLTLVLGSLGMKTRQLLDSLVLVKPATLVGWHREIVRRHWTTFRAGRRPGRPPISEEARRLLVRIARDNPRMGYTKLAGEMRKLGYADFGRSTVARILKQHGLTPERRRGGGLSWLQFLRHYGQFIWASDLCTVTTATLRTYYLVFFLEIGTRRIIHWNVSTSPDEARVAQQFRNLPVVSDDLPRYLIHDRDRKYTRRPDSLLEVGGTKVIRLPVRSPDLNGYAECWIRSLRQECLDRIIVLNESHLRWVLEEYVRYYNERRPHQALQHLPPEAPEAYPCEGTIVARPVLGGLINDYGRLAA